jgi:hypothetical protein
MARRGHGDARYDALASVSIMRTRINVKENYSRAGAREIGRADGAADVRAGREIDLP